MSTLLMVMNPREIAESCYSIAQLDVDKVWLTGYAEHELADVIDEVVVTTNYDVYSITADDVIVGQRAFDAVLDLAERVPVATGWSNLDVADRRHVSNLTRSPLKGDKPSPESFDLYTVAEVLAHPEPQLRTWFTGLSLTTMRSDMWLRYRIDALPSPPLGCCSDWLLSKRLELDEVPIVAAREGMTIHLKETWNTADTNPRKRVMVGEKPAEVRWEREWEAVCA